MGINEDAVNELGYITPSAFSSKLLFTLFNDSMVAHF